ncbi:TM1812 family CRISPR-associated protein [Caldicellulosiruptor naganoensis]|uniref:TM1812 family CRISPR-associated protein n=1 Tax=Caldicellulosiruptor naganoensis TaxID=29324 RepID=UPI0005EAF69B|nr:hypothetical protein [Caldicellulosiruptor naganoensis]
MEKIKNEKDSKDRMQRNFFAHCGLEEHFVFVAEEKEGTFVRYIEELPELRDTIKRDASSTNIKSGASCAPRFY